MYLYHCCCLSLILLLLFISFNVARSILGLIIADIIPPSTDGGYFGRCTGLPLFKAIISNIFKGLAGIPISQFDLNSQ